MLDTIISNPYRILGVYTNASRREIISNESRIKAFIKVSRPIGFSTDMSLLMDPPVRNDDTVADAVSELSMDRRKVRYAMFWFIKASPLDDMALRHLAAGNVRRAMAIWQMSTDASSLQNRIVVSLLHQDYATAINLADALYRVDSDSPVNLAKDLLQLVDIDPSYAPMLYEIFLDELSHYRGIPGTLEYVSDPRAKAELANRAICSHRDSANHLLEDARHRDSSIRNAVTLLRDCSPHLGEIYSICSHHKSATLVARHLSTKIGELMLSMIIAEVNVIIPQGDSTAIAGNHKLAAMLRNALAATATIRVLHLDPIFVSSRLDPQEQKLRSIYRLANTATAGSLPAIDPDNIPTFNIDLRHRRQVYEQCQTATDYLYYCRRYPDATNRNEAMNRYESLTLDGCTTIDQVRHFIETFPKSRYIERAHQIIDKMTTENDYTSKIQTNATTQD